MPDDNDDQHIVLNFQPRPKSKPNAKSPQRTGREPPTSLQSDPEDMVASGAVVLALIVAVAIVSGWLPVDRYAFGIVAGLAALAVAAKLIKARRSKASVTNLPRQPK
jgi:hypothetical protein